MAKRGHKNPRLSWSPIRAKSTVLILSFLMFTGAACARKDTYRPIYYPDKDNLTVYTRGPAFDNLTQARQWARDQHQQRGDSNWDYEVGLNCRPFDKDTDLEVCKETLR